MKKYRLKINYSEITEENFEVAQRIRECEIDGKIGTFIGGVSERSHFTPCDSSKMVLANDIPKSWITEIKEVLSFEEWLNGDGTGKNVRAENPVWLAQDAWNAAIENYKLSQEPSEEKDNTALSKLHDEINDFTRPSLSFKESIEYIWHNALKYARGQN